MVPSFSPRFHRLGTGATRGSGRIAGAGLTRAVLGQPAVEGSVALALLVSGMEEAAAAYALDPEGAAASLRSVVERFSADAEGDEALAAEIEFAAELLRLMEAGAPQGDLYGPGVVYL